MSGSKSGDGRVRVSIDKDLLSSFFAHPSDEITMEELGEVRKVIRLVLNAHFSSYYHFFDDLQSQVLLTVLERHDRFDSSFPPYNYIYTMARNEAGNLLRRLLREQGYEDVPLHNEVYIPAEFSELGDLLGYLSGRADFIVFDVPADKVSMLLLFCERGLSTVSDIDVVRESLLERLINTLIL